jgi:quercetin dioxygenase-like cupin family protein
MPGSVEPAETRVVASNTQERKLTHHHALSCLALAVAVASVSLVTAGGAVELDPAAVAFVTPDQYKWRDPSDRVTTNQATLFGDPNKAGGIYFYINKFKPGRFGNPHYHPNDRFITVIDGESWHGTGAVVDTAHAHVVPKGTFMIDHANKVHWGGNKEVGGSYLIAGIGPGSSVEVPKASGPWAGGDPSAATVMLPDQIPWRDHGTFKLATLAGDPDKRGLFVQMLTLLKGADFSRPHVHPGPVYTYVLSGTWWVGTGNKFDPANLTVPMKPGTFVTHFGNRVHWDGAKDEDVTLLLIGEGPVTTARVEEAR